MRSRLAASCLLLLAAAGGGLLVTRPAGSQTVEPVCPAFSREPIPTTFEGCAALEAKVRDVAAFDHGADGFDLRAYEEALAEFFSRYCHRDRDSGWVRDERVRDLGPYVAILQGDSWTDPAYYGTHHPVVIWYSPDMAEWIRRYRAAEGEEPAGDAPPPPAGAIMAKEMYPPPAEKCQRVPPEHLDPGSGAGIAFMVYAPEMARDGWFWGSWWDTFEPDWPAGAANDNGYPAMGFGQYCLNCHASARDYQTFADAKNFEGSGDVNVYLSQSFLFENRLTPGGNDGQHVSVVETADDPVRHASPLKKPLAVFLRHFRNPAGDGGSSGTSSGESSGEPEDAVVPFPSQTYDNVWVSGEDGPTPHSQFVTSDQCIGCHDAGSTGVQFDMTAPDPASNRLVNLSPYGTWRDSPMGLGGRDPIFYAQLASETQTFHPGETMVPLVEDICFGCHGIQGQRQRAIDRHLAGEGCGKFTRDLVKATPWPRTGNPHLAEAPYGALARDGIACTACHHMVLTEEESEEVAGDPANVCVEERQELLNPDNERFARTFTGSFFVGRPDRLIGPFTAPKTLPMDHALGIQPEADPTTIRSSELCGTCHTVHLPIYRGEELLGRTYEQTTYPEWAFSAYRTGSTPNGDLPEGPGPLAESCQGCHMQTVGDSKIASIQEYSNFPASDNTADPEEIDLPVRPDFATHTLVGLNVFFNQMAQQFPDILGIRTQDPMMGKKGLDPVFYTERAMLEQASESTATVTVPTVEVTGGKLEATVDVASHTGHKLPSGVGFRRAFLAFEVLDAEGEVLWASGRTDAAGVLVDQNHEPIEGELWWREDCSERYPGTPHQPHYQRIRRQDQAQIYQELVTSPAPVPNPNCGFEAVPGGQLTTSFLSICGHVKDNRILPTGFLPEKARIRIAEHLGAGEDLARDAGPWKVDGDPDYATGGGDSLVYEVDVAGLSGEPTAVRATLYYQAIPPFYLQDRFCTARGEDPERLYYLASHLDLDGRMADWKLEVVGSGTVAIE